MASRTLNVVLAGDSKKFVRAMTDGEKRAQQFERALKAAAVAGAAALTGVGALAVQRAQEIDELSKAAKVSAEEFQRLEAQARLTGGRGDDLSDVIREMTLRLQEARDLGTGPAVDALQLLGLTVQDFQNLDAPASFAKLRDAIASVDDSGQRLLLTEELLGGSSERLQGLLELNTEEYGKLIEQTKDLTIQTQQSIDATLEFNRQLSLLKDQGLARALNGALLLTDALGITDAAMAGQTSTVQELVKVYGDEVGQGLWGTVKAYFTTTKAADTILAENNQRLLEMAEAAANATDNWLTLSQAEEAATTSVRGAKDAIANTADQLDLYRDAVWEARNSTTALTNDVAHLGGVYAELANASTVASAAIAFADVMDPTVMGAAAQARSNAVLGNLGGVYSQYLSGLQGGINVAGVGGSGAGRGGGGRRSGPVPVKIAGDISDLYPDLGPDRRTGQRDLFDLVRQIEEDNQAERDALRISINELIGRGRSQGFNIEQISQLAEAFGRDQLLNAVERSAYFADTGFRSEVDKLTSEFKADADAQIEAARINAEELRLAEEQAAELLAERIDLARDANLQEIQEARRERQQLDMVRLQFDKVEADLARQHAETQERYLEQIAANTAANERRVLGQLFGGGGHAAMAALQLARERGTYSGINPLDAIRADHGFLPGPGITGGTTNNIVVNAPGGDPDAVADAVETGLQRLERQGRIQTVTNQVGT